MRCMNGKDCRTFYLIVIVFTYLVIGAVIMMKLERPIEKAARDRLFRIRSEFLMNNTCIAGKEMNSTIKHRN